jgi:tetratricopeptide (TPR) repeat protein
MVKITINQLLQQGVDAHKAGHFQVAHRLYAAILKVQPKHPDANHNTGLLVVGLGKIELALPFFKTALEANPRNAQFWYSHIIALIKLERFIDAKVLLNQSKSKGIKGADFDQLEKRLNEANKVLFIKPNNANAYFSMGITLQNQSKLEEAIEAYKKALAIKPDYVDAYNNIGNALLEKHNLEEAIEAYKKALAIKPDYVDAYYNMGNVLQHQGKLEEAIEAYNKALAIKPDFVDAYYNMGNAFIEKHNLEEAIEAYIKAISIKPDHAKAYNNMGKALQDQGKLEEAKEVYNKAISIKPNYADAHNNIGNVFKDQGKLEEAKEAYNMALDIQPDNADIHHNLSFALLAAKDFDRGFIQSEWRWKTKKRDGTFLQSAKPMWNGEKKQRVLVWGEQGIGDELMFSSIIPELYATSLKILVKCDKRLIPLFERSFPGDVIYFSKDQPVPEDEYDFHIPMGSLPLTFRKSLDSFKKSASGFLKSDMSKVKSLKAKLMNEYDKKIVGISWKTGSTITDSSNRNINLAELARALDSSNTQLLCLQYGDVSDEIEAVKRDFGIEIIQLSDIDNKNDIDSLASLVIACDQIVSTTNATVHLAGALGAKVTVLLPFSPRWIWGDGSESFWYGSVTPLKQNLYQNWDNVLEKLDLNKSNLIKKES